MNRRQFNFGFLGAASAIPFRSLRTIVTVPGAVATGLGTQSSRLLSLSTDSCTTTSSRDDCVPRPVAAARRTVTELRVNGRRLMEHINALAEFGKNPQGGVSRLAYSEADARGREYVMGLMRAAKLDVSIDAAGNLIGRRAGSDSSLKPILFGSHIDSVPEGGNYDGDVGSLGAIEVAQTLGEINFVTHHPLEVVIFQNEEGGLIGSRAMDGQLTEKELDLVSRSGKTIREGIKFIGGDPTKLATARRGKGSIAAYLELHIEQGGILEKEKIDIGVVEGIVGINWWDVTIEGFANHAGTTPMNQRQDALLAAAKFIEAVNRVVTSIPGRQVGTVGRIQALPGAPNVIPGKVILSLELRDLDAAKIQMLYQKIRTEADQIAQASKVKFDFKEINVNIPAPTDPRLRALIDQSAKDLGLTTKQMPSGAGHDAQDMARLAPVGMIFIPSIGGISHSPKEFSRPKDIENGANVLLGALLKVDRVSLLA
ncbi:MAG TPA: M20 family metallo-hydrolase [Pyrinomonadaceae bacterium]|nr:M20 family metallo-hydrolase [Pyrinomonadaceae bacterium]